MEIIPSSFNGTRLTALALLFAIACVVVWLRRDRRLVTIPKAGGRPLIGLGLRLPPNAPVLFRQWAEKHGELFRVRVGWYDWVIINTPAAIREILEKQAVSTSSKAPSPMGHDIVTGGKRMPTMPYGPHWRAQRSVVRHATTVPMTATFTPSQEFETKQLLYDIATDNQSQSEFFQHIRRYAFSIIMTNTFGTRIQTSDHPDLHNAMRSQMILRETSRPGAFIVDTFPPLASLPQWLRPGQSRAKAAAKEVLDIKMRLWQRIADQVASGKAPHCLARTIFEEKQHWYLQGLTDEDLAWVAGGLIEAGFETTAATLNTLVMMLATNPRVQREAQKELMRFVGPDRLPCFADLQKLPYVRACVKEALRMNPILAPGIMHFADQDVVYKDHIIPKGTVLVANTAFLHFDPGRFDKPFEFMPERYLSHTLYSSEYAAMGDPYKRDHFTFSTGRRTCPGARIAENSLGIALAGLLWAFEIRLPLVNQVEVQIDTSNHAFTDGGFAIPKPFAARFVPWTKEREQLVRDEWYRASKEGYSLRGAHTNVTGIVVS